MTLRFELEQCPETIQEFELAAQQKYDEALDLMVSGKGGAGIYLMGYVAEMLLKNAYFRFIGLRPADRIDESRRVPARRRGEALLGRGSCEGYHSLRFWTLLLIHERGRTGRLLPIEIRNRFVHCTRRLYQHWWIGMRYRYDRCDTRHVRTVFSDVNWLRDHYLRLWR
jgi:hypothetical protein